MTSNKFQNVAQNIGMENLSLLNELNPNIENRVTSLNNSVPNPTGSDFVV